MACLRFIARFIIALVLLAALSGGIAALPAQVATAIGFSGSGAGIEGNPYQITSWAQLNEVRNHLDKHFILMNNLGPGDTGYDTYASSTANAGVGWEPIGTSATPFTGTFDGDGHTISGLFINRPGTDNVGLFGYVSGGTVKNVTLSGVDITGQHQVGGLVGYTITSTSTTISNSHAAGNVSGTGSVGGLVGINYGDTIEDSSASGKVVGTGNNIGGLVGYNYFGAIYNSNAAGDVSSGGSYVGGLVGYTSTSEPSTISNSHATGDVSGASYVGGLVGYNDGDTIEDSSASGKVSSETGNYVGGLVGYNYFGAIYNSNAAGDVSSGGYYVGGLVGYTSTSTPATISNSHATGDVSGASNVGGLAGYNDGDTILRSYAEGSVTGTGSVGGLVGNNFGGTVEESYAEGSVTGEGNVGGLVGQNTGTVTNSYASGDVSGGASGYDVGGLVGTNEGTISESYATGSVTGTTSVGGLVGSNTGMVTNSFWDTQTSGTENSAEGTGKTTAEMKDIDTFTNWDIGQTFLGNPTGGYPFLSWQIGNSPTWLIYGDTTPPPPPAGGGADWGWIPGPSMGLTLVGASGQWEISSEGRILSDGYLTSADGSVTVFIPYLTKLLGPDGTPVDEISVTPIDPPPAPEGMHILAAFDFQPDGATFDRDGIQIIISFDPSAAAPGDTVVIAFFNEATGAWEFIEGTVNPDGTATFNVHHFTVFAVMSGTPVVSTAPEKAPEPTAEAVELSAPAVTGDASGGLGSAAWFGLAVGIITLLGIAWLLKYRRRSA